MRQATFAQFVDYDRATGGYVYNDAMAKALERLGWQIGRLDMPPGFPEPAPATLRWVAERVAAIPDATPVLIDQVCLCRILAVAESESRRLQWIEIFHHAMAHDAVADGASRAISQGNARAAVHDAIDNRERQALALAERVLVTSPSTARTVRDDYGVSPERLILALPGTERFPARDYSGNAADRPARLLCVGAIVPRKDHLLLVDALARLAKEAPDLRWHLDIVGNPDRDPAHVQALHRSIAGHGLTAAIRVAGRLDATQLDGLWRSADLYVSASRHEGYGMAIAEAIGRGIPVVTTAGGAVTDWLPQEAAVATPVGDAAALGLAIGSVLGDDGRWRAMARAAARASFGMPTWGESAAILSKALASLVRP